MNARTLYIYISNNLQIALSIENNKKNKIKWNQTTKTSLLEYHTHCMT